jgi:hypothetical protein
LFGRQSLADEESFVFVESVFSFAGFQVNFEYFPGYTEDSLVAVALPVCSKVFSSKILPLCESHPQNDKFPENVILQTLGRYCVKHNEPGILFLLR